MNESIDNYQYRGGFNQTVEIDAMLEAVTQSV